MNISAAKQHLHKYQQALLQTLREVTARDLTTPSVCEPTLNYTAAWYHVGFLALLVWQSRALAEERFEAHPQWEAVATEAIRFLAKHCAGCGKPLTTQMVRFCGECLTTLDPSTRYVLQDSEVALQIAAYLAEQEGL